MNPGQITCTSCSATFSVAADAQSATCPGCGEILALGAQPAGGERLPSKTLPLTSGPGAVAPVPDGPPVAPDPFGDDLPGMVEGDEIDMAFFESSADPAKPPPLPDDGIPEVQQMPTPQQTPPPQPPPQPPADPPADPPVAEEDEDNGVLGKIPLRRASADGSRPLPPLMPAGDGVPEAAPLQAPVEEKKPVHTSREASRPPPNILAGPATPPIKLPDQGIEVTIPLAPVEEVSRHETGGYPAQGGGGKAGSPRHQTAELSPLDPARNTGAHKQSGANRPARPAASRKFVFIGVAALAGVVAAVMFYWLMGT